MRKCLNRASETAHTEEHSGMKWIASLQSVARGRHRVDVSLAVPRLLFLCRTTLCPFQGFLPPAPPPEAPLLSHFDTESREAAATEPLPALSLHICPFREGGRSHRGTWGRQEEIHPPRGALGKQHWAVVLFGKAAVVMPIGGGNVSAGSSSALLSDGASP